MLFVFTGCSNNIPESNPIDTMATTEQTSPSENTTVSTENTLSAETQETIAEETFPQETEPENIPEPNNEDLVEISKYIPNIVVELKYATTDNFTGVVIYDNNVAMLRYGTVKKLINVQKELNELGYTLVIWDAYRPKEAQFKLWDVCPDSRYVANPHKGFSSHSRGNTIDITIQKLNGDFVEMPTKFDEFSRLADRDYSDVSNIAKENSLLLETLMKKYGFKPYSAEWWHYSDTKSYDVV